MTRKIERVVYSPIPPLAVVDAVRLLRICVALAVVFGATPVVVTLCASVLQLEVPRRSVPFMFSKQAVGMIDSGPAVVGKLLDRRALRTRPEWMTCVRMAPRR